LYLIEKKYVDTKGNLVNLPYGVASVKYKRDERGLLIEQVIFDKNGVVVNENDTGVAIITYQYEDNGKLLKSTKLNSKREPLKE